MSEEITALAIQIKGEIISSNFDDFKANALAKIEGMKYELLNDDDFIKAKKDIKDLEITGKALKGAKEEILKQLDDVYSLMGGIDEIITAANECRLSKSKEVKKRDAEIKAKIIEDALVIIDHSKREKFRQEVSDGAKGKRSFETMAKGANAAASAINESILKTRAILDEFSEEHGKILIPDRLDLELQSFEGVASELVHRLEKKRDEEEKERLRAEAEKAQKESEAAKAETKEPKADPASPETPPPPKIGTIPVGESAKQAAENPEEEMARFIETVKAAFSPVKAARLSLKHTENINRAQTFAKGLSQAWAQLNSPNQ